MSGIKLVVNVMRVGGRVGCEILTCCFLCRDKDERFRVGKKISGSTHMAGVNSGYSARQEEGIVSARYHCTEENRTLPSRI